MKRRHLLLPLAMVIVALFADDVKFILHFPLAVGVQSTVTIRADSSVPMTAIRLVDGAVQLMEAARNGRLLRDSVAKLFTETPSPLAVPCAGVGANIRRTPPLASSLVSQHTRLQV
jgi:hypothetical protein